MQTKTKSGFLAHFLFNPLRSDKVISIVVFLISLLVYEIQAPLRLSSANLGSDGGDYLTAILTGGVPHPTGYPLYLLLSSQFHYLPFHTPVWRQAQVSIFAASLAVAFFCYLCLILPSKLSRGKKVVSSVLASLSLSFSSLFWSQAVIIEVYSLNALWFILALLWINNYSLLDPAKSKSKMCVFSFLCGLGLANHTTFLLLYPLVAIIHIDYLRIERRDKWIWLSGFGWLSGVLLYLLLPVSAAGHPPIAWGNPSSLNGFMWLISGGDYGRNLFRIQSGEYFQRFFATMRVFIIQTGWIGIALAILGIFQYSDHPKFRWATIYLVIVYSVFSIGYKTNDSIVYLIPAIVCLVFWLKWGLEYLFTIQFFSNKLGFLPPLIVAISIVLSFPSTFRSVDPRTGDLADYAESMLQSASFGETILPQTDGETFALWYYHYGLKWRPDVRIISRGLEQYSWYRSSLQRLYPDYIYESDQ